MKIKKLQGLILQDKLTVESRDENIGLGHKLGHHTGCKISLITNHCNDWV